MLHNLNKLRINSIDFFGHEKSLNISIYFIILVNNLKIERFLSSIKLIGRSQLTN